MHFRGGGRHPYGPKGFARLPRTPSTYFHFPSTVQRKRCDVTRRASAAAKLTQTQHPAPPGDRPDCFSAAGRFEGKRKEWWGRGGGEKTLVFDPEAQTRRGAVWVVSPPPHCISRIHGLIEGTKHPQTSEAHEGTRRTRLDFEQRRRAA
jgi:hypothetical protein